MMTMIVTLVVVGVVLFLVNKFVPMSGKIKKVLNWSVAAAVALWLLYSFGLFNRAQDVAVPSLG